MIDIVQQRIDVLNTPSAKERKCFMAINLQEGHCEVETIIDNLIIAEDTAEKLMAFIDTKCRKQHYYCEDCYYSCPQEEDGCCDETEGDDCNCGADKHNAAINELLEALK